MFLLGERDGLFRCQPQTFSRRIFDLAQVGLQHPGQHQRGGGERHRRRESGLGDQERLHQRNEVDYLIDWLTISFLFEAFRSRSADKALFHPKSLKLDFNNRPFTFHLQQ